jgi:hypothetical protein
MMKTNVITVDASLLLVMKNSTFALLTDCFAFARLSSDIYATTQQSLLFPHHLAVWCNTPGSIKFSGETGQTGEDTG